MSGVKNSQVSVTNVLIPYFLVGKSLFFFFEAFATVLLLMFSVLCVIKLQLYICGMKSFKQTSHF